MKTAHIVADGQASSPGFCRFADLGAELLSLGLGVRFRAPGTSMHPTIRHGDLITVEPVEPCNLKNGDIILYHLQNSFIAHRIVNIEDQNGCGLTFILRGDASAGCDAPVKPEQVLGKVVSLERNHRHIDLYSWRVRFGRILYLWLAWFKRSVLLWFSADFHPHPNPPPSGVDLGTHLTQGQRK